MKALSWREPYASLMLYGKIETRTWKTSYRGPVIICTSKKPYPLHTVLQISGDYQLQRIMDTLNIPDPGNFGDLNCGYAIGIGDLVDCRPMTPEDEDACFVKYNTGLWCHVYENISIIKTPYPIKGKLGWFNINDDVLEKMGYKVQYITYEMDRNELEKKLIALLTK